MRQFLIGPVNKNLALGFEKGAQVFRAVGFAQRGFLLFDDVEIDQRQFQFVQPPLGAQQPAVDFRLGPVQGAVVGGHQIEITAEGFHLLQAVALGVVAIGAAAHFQVFELATQSDLVFVALAPATGHHGVAGDAFLGGGRRREPQVQVAGLGRELAQGAHRHGVGVGRPDGVGHCHVTWQTATGRSRAMKKSSQRRWLSCSRSPGPFTSTIR